MAIAICICVAVKFSGLPLTAILALNGTLLSFVFTYVLPIGLLIKCVYFKEPAAESKLRSLPPLEEVYNKSY
jgi:hypothetical protein